MATHPQAGQRPEPSQLVGIPALVAAHHAGHPDATAPERRVSFGASGHRGGALSSCPNKPHHSGCP
ncbi:hypothetical protein [Nitratidesulfovibrio sp.]|uniref:hypothetical protein n=1 Tax=Nitratidesulfovibrio sp. TaxID=2802297 RepID=UPI003341301E